LIKRTQHNVCRLKIQIHKSLRVAAPAEEQQAEQKFCSSFHNPISTAPTLRPQKSSNCFTGTIPFNHTSGRAVNQFFGGIAAAAGLCRAPKKIP
jgi:hypothetical protein